METVTSAADVRRELATLASAGNRIDEQMKMLRTAVKSGILAPDSREDAAVCGSIGAMVKAAARGDTNKIQEMGGNAGYLETKADLGTPLVGGDGATAYLVPTQFYEGVMRIVEERSELMSQVTKWEMNAKTIDYPRKNAGISLTKVGTDGGDLAEANPTFTGVAMSAYTYAAWVGLSQELLEDNDTNLGQYFRELFGEAAATTFDTELLTSAATPVGLFNDTSTRTVTMANGSPGFSDVRVSDLRDMVKDLALVKGALRNAHFIMSPWVHETLRDEVNAQGDPIIAAWIDSTPRRINGKPILLSYEAPDSADSAASTKFVALGDPRNLVWGERIALEVKVFDATQYAVTNTEILIRCRVRWGFDVALPSAFTVLKTSA